MRCFFTFLVVMLLASSGRANPFLEFNAGSEAARPFSGRSASEGSEAAYFNPARLQAKESNRSDVPRHALPVADRAPDSTNWIRCTETVYQARVERDGQLKELDFRPFQQPCPPRRAFPDGDPRHPTFLNFGASIDAHSRAFGGRRGGRHGPWAAQTQRPFYVDEREQFYANRLNYEL